MVQLHKKDWSDRLLEALWAYRKTRRSTTGFFPYDLVYGKHVLPIEFQIKTFKMTTDLGMDPTEAQKQRTAQLNELDEMRQKDFQHTDIIQHQRKRWHDRVIENKQFNE
jgi:hypothetical protein